MMLLQRSLILASSLLFAASLQAATVVSSLKPISLIAAELLDGVAEVKTLLPEGASPHDYALKPSDRRVIDSADLMIWIGPETEPYLQKVIAASGVADLRWQESEEEHAEHAEDVHEHELEPEDEHAEHDHDSLHPWLSPESTEHFAERIAAAMQQAFPQSTDQIAANAQRFMQSLAAFDTEANRRLEPVQGTGFFVFHDAYQGLVEHYALNQVGFFTIDPSRKPGAKHLAQLREQLEQSRASCVFVEPQYSAALIESVTRGLNVRQGELDPLAGGVQPAVGSYQQFMRGLVAELESCLAPL